MVLLSCPLTDTVGSFSPCRGNGWVLSSSSLDLLETHLQKLNTGRNISYQKLPSKNQAHYSVQQPFPPTLDPMCIFKDNDSHRFFLFFCPRCLTCIWVLHMSNPPPARSCSSLSAATWGQSGRYDTEWCCSVRCFQLCAGVWGQAWRETNIRREHCKQRQITNPASTSCPDWTRCL